MYHVVTLVAGGGADGPLIVNAPFWSHRCIDYSARGAPHSQLQLAHCGHCSSPAPASKAQAEALRN